MSERAINFGEPFPKKSFLWKIKLFILKLFAEPTKKVSTLQYKTTWFELFIDCLS
jgi:hypothetical protein